MECNQLAGVIHRLWGEEVVECTPLVGEVDRNFRVLTTSGSRSVVKVMREGCRAEEVALQAGALDRIATTAPEVPVPRVIATASGESFGEAAGRLVWRISWLSGERLESVRPRTPELLWDIGGSLGRIQQALEGFDPPAVHRQHDWDLARAGIVLERAAVIRDPRRRSRVVEAAAAFHERVEPVLGALPAGVIHGDGNDFNLLVAVPDRVGRDPDFRKWGVRP